jgi:hypothetical protein
VAVDEASCTAVNLLTAVNLHTAVNLLTAVNFHTAVNLLTAVNLHTAVNLLTAVNLHTAVNLLTAVNLRSSRPRFNHSSAVPGPAPPPRSIPRRATLHALPPRSTGPKVAGPSTTWVVGPGEGHNITSDAGIVTSSV